MVSPQAVSMSITACQGGPGSIQGRPAALPVHTRLYIGTPEQVYGAQNQLRVAKPSVGQVAQMQQLVSPAGVHAAYPSPQPVSNFAPRAGPAFSFVPNPPVNHVHPQHAENGSQPVPAAPAVAQCNEGRNAAKTQGKGLTAAAADHEAPHEDAQSDDGSEGSDDSNTMVDAYQRLDRQMVTGLQSLAAWDPLSAARSLASSVHDAVQNQLTTVHDAVQDQVVGAASRILVGECMDVQQGDSGKDSEIVITDLDEARREDRDPEVFLNSQDEAGKTAPLAATREFRYEELTSMQEAVRHDPYLAFHNHLDHSRDQLEAPAVDIPAEESPFYGAGVAAATLSNLVVTADPPTAETADVHSREVPAPVNVMEAPMAKLAGEHASPEEAEALARYERTKAAYLTHQQGLEQMRLMGHGSTDLALGESNVKFYYCKMELVARRLCLLQQQASTEALAEVDSMIANLECEKRLEDEQWHSQRSRAQSSMIEQPAKPTTASISVSIHDRPPQPSDTHKIQIKSHYDAQSGLTRYLPVEESDVPAGHEPSPSSNPGRQDVCTDKVRIAQVAEHSLQSGTPRSPFESMGVKESGVQESLDSSLCSGSPSPKGMKLREQLKSPESRSRELGSSPSGKVQTNELDGSRVSIPLSRTSSRPEELPDLISFSPVAGDTDKASEQVLSPSSAFGIVADATTDTSFILGGAGQNSADAGAAESLPPQGDELHYPAGSPVAYDPSGGTGAHDEEAGLQVPVPHDASASDAGAALASCTQLYQAPSSEAPWPCTIADPEDLKNGIVRQYRDAGIVGIAAVDDDGSKYYNIEYDLMREDGRLVRLYAASFKDRYTDPTTGDVVWLVEQPSRPWPCMIADPKNALGNSYQASILDVVGSQPDGTVLFKVQYQRDGEDVRTTIEQYPDRYVLPDGETVRLVFDIQMPRSGSHAP
eukprot:TRINITY_DN28794_c0_g1_i1.p1 TRINITY_DN28794_c0_g1~~TRINITY_DN28794_c0_g1_i1.p1  ORF type:complete len:974 (+),score=156.91 TRINITY_DN28794_c0_g1_i1:123-2924(+)